MEPNLGAITYERKAAPAGWIRFISLRQPTKGMRDEAAHAGQVEYRGRMYDRLQLRSVAELLTGRLFDTPSRVETMEWQRQTVLPV